MPPPVSRNTPWPVAVDARVLAVVGSCGGVGTSTFAAAVAAVARADGPAALVDLDTEGGGLDVLLGVEDVVGARWPDLYAARGVVPAGELLASLPRWRGVPVLSADRRRPGHVADDVRTAVLDALRSGSTTLVLDVPGAAAASVPGDATTALVVPRTVVGLAHALAATRRPAGTAGAGGAVGAQVAVVAARPTGHLHPADVADALGLPVVARVRHDRRSAADVERGTGPRVGRGTALRSAARALLGAVR
ncbi:pilus assembly protein FlpE [Luteimicrobium subarcticum]|uniref:Secretion/DNA translocation related CpaE-like protein n=1 Tax=Luteimicrobium subarcticum TaxID=620910 RepID=A0A2M8WSH3_9MICO|nr:pilus assembly protein FlpE [Luteimicrobium subarcticum]PJI93870.1 secretion/DNA translocation related CpaE-like protein [Luteimicrobium subarcticum]